jgi:hypothetical protein
LEEFRVQFRRQYDMRQKITNSEDEFHRFRHWTATKSAINIISSAKSHLFSEEGDELSFSTYNSLQPPNTFDELDLPPPIILILPEIYTAADPQTSLDYVFNNIPRRRCPSALQTIYSQFLFRVLQQVFNILFKTAQHPFVFLQSLFLIEPMLFSPLTEKGLN